MGPASWPQGFRYLSQFAAGTEAEALVQQIRGLEFSPVVMRGTVARRRVVHFGWRYGYESWRISPGPPIPPFLVPLRQRAAALIGLSSEDLAEVMVTEYQPGAGIGWHRDAPMFGDVVGISLLGVCRLRFQRGRGPARVTSEVTLEPGSAYVLAGAARWAWQHSIPPTKAARYSVTFRPLKR